MIFLNINNLNVSIEGKKILVSHPGATVGSFTLPENLSIADSLCLVEKLIEYAKNDTQFEIRSPYANLKAKVVPLPFFDPKKRIPIK